MDQVLHSSHQGGYRPDLAGVTHPSSRPYLTVHCESALHALQVSLYVHIHCAAQLLPPNLEGLHLLVEPLRDLEELDFPGRPLVDLVGLLIIHLLVAARDMTESSHW